MGWGIGIGIGWGSNTGGISVAALISEFKARVFADTGTYSAESCQVATLTALNNI
jgi:hypothetical protein